MRKILPAIIKALQSINLSVRIGIHIGDKLARISVHIGSRISAQAEPNRIWVSQTVKDRVAGSGLSFEHMGLHDLKGVPDRWYLHPVIERVP